MFSNAEEVVNGQPVAHAETSSQPTPTSTVSIQTEQTPDAAAPFERRIKIADILAHDGRPSRLSVGCALILGVPIASAGSVHCPCGM
jgi:hypothetical protein